MNTLRERDRIVDNVKDDALRISMSFFITPCRLPFQLCVPKASWSCR